MGIPVSGSNEAYKPVIISFERRKDLITTALVLAEQAFKQHPDLTPEEAGLVSRAFAMSMPGNW